MTISIVLSIYAFLKEFIYGKSRDRRKRSIVYKIKSYTIIITITLSLVLNWYLGERTYNIGKKYVQISKQYKALLLDNEKNESCVLENEILKNLLNSCSNKIHFDKK